jgi:hypothetical protein
MAHAFAIRFMFGTTRSVQQQPTSGQARGQHVERLISAAPLGM